MNEIVDRRKIHLRHAMPLQLTNNSKEVAMNTLKGKTALVTGASRGIGRAAASALAKSGAQVLVHYSSGKAEAKAVADEIIGAGGRAEIIGADLWNPDGPHQLAREVRGIIGDRLDILVANAGVTKSAPIQDLTVEDFDRLFAVNVRAPYFLVQQLLSIRRRTGLHAVTTEPEAHRSTGRYRRRRCLPGIGGSTMGHRRYRARRRRLQAITTLFPQNFKELS
jgi:NAD(P)-dependent dehydrogenase (short-subunit alcohol dehydrogenase family)